MDLYHVYTAPMGPADVGHLKTHAVRGIGRVRIDLSWAGGQPDKTRDLLDAAYAHAVSVLEDEAEEVRP